MGSRYTASQAAAAKNYLKKQDEIRIRLPKGDKAKYKAMAEASGKSLNQFILDRIKLGENEIHTDILEEQGLLLRLPCKVGNIIYRVNAGAKEPVIKMRVLQVIYKQLHKDRIIIRIDAINDNDMGESCYLLEDFGKTVFLTQAEAEQKLMEMENK